MRADKQSDGEAQTIPSAVGGSALQRACACGNHTSGGDCGACRDKRGMVQRAGGSSAIGEVPEIVSEVLHSPGQPLDSFTRDQMESKLGHDFSHVRIHNDQQAGESARAVDALAYTVGNNVVFGARLFRPSSTEGRQLLAHELTHVVQQGAGLGPLSANLSAIDPDPSAEVEARAVGGSMRNASSIRPQTISHPVVQRSVVGAPTKEEERVTEAKTSGFLTADAAKISSAFSKALAATKTAKEAEALVQKSGEDIWKSATAAAKAGGAGTDDRQIYWIRLMMTTELRQWKPAWVKDADALAKLQKQLIELLEQTSRGMTSATFPTDLKMKRKF